MGTQQSKVIFMVFWLVGCGSIPKPAQFDGDPQPFLNSLERRATAIKAVSAELSVEIWKDSKRLKVKQFVAADEQGRLRLETVSPFGTPLLTLASDGGRLMIYDAEQARFFLGPVTQEALSKLIPVPMSPGELASLLRGGVPVMSEATSTLSWNSKAGRYVLTLKAGNRVQVIEFEPQHNRVTSLWTELNGRKLYSIRLGQYSGTGDAIIPLRIRFVVPKQELSIDMAVKDHTLDPELPAGAFTLTPPRGIVVEPL